MPFVSISTVRGALDADQKQELLRKIADVLVEIEGRGREDFRRMVWVRVEEHEPEHWSIGGLVASREHVAKMFGPIGPDGRRSKPDAT